MRLPIFIVLVCAVLSGCDSKAPKAADAGAPPVADASGGDAAVDAAASDTRVVEEAPPGPLPTSPLAPPASPSDVEKLAPAESFGTISGPIFGAGSKIHAMIRTSCGDGTVLKPIFRRAPDAKLEVGTAIPLQFYNLATGRPVTYNEGDFEVTVNFAEDSDERLRGKLKITFEELGEEKTYAEIEYDGPTISTMVPPSMEGSGNVVTYPKCFPNGYFQLVEKDGSTTYGLTRIVDVEGAAIAQLMVGEASMMQIMATARDAKKGIDPAQKVESSEARRTAGNVAMLFDVIHRPQLIEPAEAVGANLGTVQQAKMVEGTATLRIYKSGGNRYFDAAFDDVRVSSILDGPLSGREFESMKIWGRMDATEEIEPNMPDAPDWYKP